MDQQKFKIVFFGTPQFAVSQLDAVVQAGYSVVAVVTAPDRPAGRGRKLSTSAVKQYAQHHNLRLFQPVNLKDESFVASLEDLQADVFIVVAFRMLPEVIWRMPPLGTFNLHASLLPDYRGAAPINRALINGEELTGLTTFFINERIDEGNIILQHTVKIEADDNAGTLHDRLMMEGRQLVTETLSLIESGEAAGLSRRQLVRSEDDLKKAPKIFKPDCRIDWTKPLDQIHNLIRGLSPHPGAFTVFMSDKGDQFEVKILRGEPLLVDHNLPLGTLNTDNRRYIRIAVTKGFYFIHIIQLPGKKAMDADALLRGFRFDGEWRVI